MEVSDGSIQWKYRVEVPGGSTWRKHLAEVLGGSSQWKYPAKVPGRSPLWDHLKEEPGRSYRWKYPTEIPNRSIIFLPSFYVFILKRRVEAHHPILMSFLSPFNKKESKGSSSLSSDQYLEAPKRFWGPKTVNTG